MPYAEPKVQLAAMAVINRARYRKDPAFRKSEAERKAEWYAANKERILAQQAAYRASRRERKAGAKKGGGK